MYSYLFTELGWPCLIIVVHRVTWLSKLGHFISCTSSILLCILLSEGGRKNSKGRIGALAI